MPTRQYRDSSGTDWEVFEVHRLDDRPNSVRPALSSGWLAFVREGEKRRLAEYPADWIALGNDELQELLNAAFVAYDARRTRPNRSGSVPPARSDEAPRYLERRKQPRPTARASRPISPAETGVLPGDRATSPSPAPAIAGGLPVPPTETATGTLGRLGVDELVRNHARQARRDSKSVIQGMIGVKRALAEAGEDVSPEALKGRRKDFVEEFFGLT